MEMMLQPLRKYADFKVRARRQEYWMFFLGIVIFEVVASLMINVAGGGNRFSLLSGLLSLVFAVVVLGLFIPAMAVAFRRLHDTDRSAWWLLIGLIPILGAIVLVVFYCLDGTPGPNRFGQDPKGRNLTDASVFS